MPSYLQNIGFTKTLIQNNNRTKLNEIQWQGDYNGKVANINVDVNDNGNREFVSMKLNNEDLKELLGIQPVNIPLEKRLKNDFLSDVVMLKSASRKSRRHKKKHHRKRKTRKTY